MIKQIQITNFQSHAETVLDLAPGVNIIVGPSDVGKTAVLRALRWLLYNRPGGTAFCRYDTRETTVVVSLTDGPTVERTRRGSTNLYTVDGMELEGFGQGVPQEVSDALRIPPLSWQGQLDAPFLLSASPGEVARVLNNVVDLSAIDRAISHSSSQLRSFTRGLKEAEALLEDSQRDLALLDWVDGAAEAVVEAETADAALHVLRERASGLEDVVERVAEKKAEMAGLPTEAQIKRWEGALEGVYAAARTMNADQDRVDLLEQDIELLEDARTRKVNATRRVGELQEKFDQLMPDVCPLCDTVLEED